MHIPSIFFPLLEMLFFAIIGHIAKEKNKWSGQNYCPVVDALFPDAKNCEGQCLRYRGAVLLIIPQHFVPFSVINRTLDKANACCMCMTLEQFNHVSYIFHTTVQLVTSYHVKALERRLFN